MPRLGGHISPVRALGPGGEIPNREWARVGPGLFHEAFIASRSGTDTYGTGARKDDPTTPVQTLPCPGGV